MINSAITTRAASFRSTFASAAFLAGVSSVERCGVVLRRSEYTHPRHVSVVSPLINTNDVRRVVFLVRLDGGIGSEAVTIDQTLDAVSALINEGDQVSVTLVDDVHVESTVAPIFAWGSAADLGSAAVSDGKVLRRGEFLDSKGKTCVASLVLAAGPSHGLVVDVQASSSASVLDDAFAPVDFVERVGVIVRRSEYTHARHAHVHSPLINSKDVRRVVFLVRLDGGIGSEMVTIDQTLDAVSALLEEGDQVSAKLVDNVHIESTVAPIFSWGDASDVDAAAVSNGRVLRSGGFLDSKGVPCVASLVLAAGDSRRLVVEVQQSN
jgi:hypothetical protein